MNKCFDEAKWIWRSGATAENDYAEFSDKFDYSGGDALVRISVCGDYTLLCKVLYLSRHKPCSVQNLRIDWTPHTVRL